MPGNLSVTVGVNTSTKSSSATNLKINNVITRFLTAVGKSIEGLTPIQIGNLYLDELWDYTIRVSSEKQTNDLNIINESTVRATVQADNDI